MAPIGARPQSFAEVRRALLELLESAEREAQEVILGGHLEAARIVEEAAQRARDVDGALEVLQNELVEARERLRELSSALTGPRSEAGSARSGARQADEGGDPPEQRAEREAEPMGVGPVPPEVVRAFRAAFDAPHSGAAPRER